MTNISVYIASPGAGTATGTIAWGLIDSLAGQFSSVGVFRPLVSDDHDDLAEALIAHDSVDQSYEQTLGVTIDQFLTDRDAALATLVERYQAIATRADAVVIVGSDYRSAAASSELGLNAVAAANLDAPVLVVANADDADPAQIQAISAHAASVFADAGTTVLGVIANHAPEAQVAQIVDELASLDLPVASAVTYSGDQLGSEAVSAYATGVDHDALIKAATAERTHLRTPRMFEYQIMAKARADKKTIVLPEAEDPRILEAASIILARDVAKIVLLGDPATVTADAAKLGFDVSGALIQPMDDPELVERFSAKYAELRAKKGVTIEQATQKMTDPSYFGTMMVYLGLADGMVSGATHTTANTIRPALEFVKTKPGTKVVSGSFLMCMDREVLVFADCAVNPNPTPEQVADIAISSAATAKAFDIEPRVGLISYSTGDSGAGEDVDAVKEATRLLGEEPREFAFAGPIQFDAAIDPIVGAKKMPDNPVAGHANVFIFPDLNTGNTTYKAVQRTAGAVAVGPVLQGLNKPVNDLSRGALVDDIVNTVAITAIQAQTGI